MLFLVLDKPVKELLNLLIDGIILDANKTTIDITDKILSELNSYKTKIVPTNRIDN